MKFSLFLSVVALSGILIACGGGGSNDDPNRRATATPDMFDPNVLSGITLTSQEVNLSGRGSFNPPQGKGVSYASVFGNDDLYIQSNVGRFADRQVRVEGFDRIRRSIAALVGSEKDYNLPGADEAFTYEEAEPPLQTMLAFKDEFFVTIVMMSRNKTHVAEATDKAALDRYSKLVFDRLLQYQADASSIHPDPNAPPYKTPAPAPPPTPAP